MYDILPDNMSTSSFVSDFIEAIDRNKTYKLQELKNILVDVYKKNIEKQKVTVVSDDSDDEKPKKKGRKPKPVDPTKEKKPPSAYNNFVKKMMEEIRKENPASAPRELMKIAGAKWKQLSDQEKIMYK